MQRNITIRLSEELARRVRVWAAEHNTSVSRLVAELLSEKMKVDDAYDRALHDWRKSKWAWTPEPAPRPSRDDLHDRASLR